MTQRDIDYQIRIHEPGTQTPTGGTVALSIRKKHLAGVPTFPAQRIDVLEGAAVSQPGEFSVLDADDFITSKLSDAQGRMSILYRLAEYRTNIGGAGWTTRAIARVTRVALDREIGVYRFEVQDELVILREAEIFKQVGATLGSGLAADYAGTRMMPLGVDGEYGDFAVTMRDFQWDVATEGNLVRVSLAILRDQLLLWHVHMASVPVMDLIRGDLSDAPTLSIFATSGNFQTLRCNIAGTDREVFGFGEERPRNADELLRDLDRLMMNEMNTLSVWVVWPDYASDPVTTPYLRMPTHEPTQTMPLHVGGSGGIHPFRFARNICQEVGARFDSASLQALIDDPSYGLDRWRPQKPENAYGFLKNHLCAPNLVAMLRGDDGEIEFKSVALPNDLDITSLFEFNASNTAPPHPTWNHEGSDICTRVKAVYERETRAPINEPGRNLERAGLLAEFAADLMKVEDEPIIKDHDRLADFGTHEREFSIRGKHRQWTRILGLLLPRQAEQRARFLKRQVFDRFGDGPADGVLFGLSTTEVVSAGDFCVINLSSYPDMETGTRGGLRIVQVLSKRPAPRNPALTEFKYLDVGPHPQALPKPALALSQTPGDEKQSIRVVVSGLATNVGYVLVVAKSDAAPADDSSLWDIAAEGDGNETVTVAPLASGATYWFKARAVAPRRVGSAWSTPQSQATQALAAPTAPSVSEITGGSFLVSWTNGETDYPLRLTIDATTCPGSRTFLVDRPAGTTQHRVRGRAVSTTYCVGIGHVDPYGGASAEATVEATTTSDLPDAPQPLDIWIAAGQ